MCCLSTLKVNVATSDIKDAYNYLMVSAAGQNYIEQIYLERDSASMKEQTFKLLKKIR